MHVRFACAFLLIAASALAGNGEPSAHDLEFFEKEVRPVLVDRCYDCHSTGKKIKGGLALDTRDGWMKGGDTGPALVPGAPGKSLLMEAVRYGNRDLQMPPKNRLSDAEIETLERWIQRGAPDPRTADDAGPRSSRRLDLAEGRHFWSFSPIARVEPPTVTGIDSPIDAFIRAKLAEHALPPAPRAEKETLIRRATFDLIGLPPTPEEVDAFVADPSSNAFDRVIERLLASPHYGERWGRHWLDVARYADSNGMDENIAFGNAWRYRDYVIRSFNEDKPFDQFVVEQIAGDLLGRDEEKIAATGFLALGARVLAEPDLRKLEMDIIDEQIDTIGKAFLGMTLGCARCHEHKFDPISQEDYYALAAIFRSTRSIAAEKLGAIKFCYEHSLATPEQLEAKKQFDHELKAKKAELAKFTAAARNAVGATPQQRDADVLDAATLATIAEKTKAIEDYEAKQPDLPGIMSLAEAEVVKSLPVHIRGSYLTLGKPIERGYPQVMLTSVTQPIFPAKQSGRLQLARWIASSDHPLTARVIVNRIWRWHFGAGLVSSTDNFGVLGARPSHPELLDWLARQFIESGWSIKDLHRLIMKSATYQQASQGAIDPAGPDPRRVDPENRLLWRANLQRLEAEQIRDALLMVSGWLDRTLGGKTIPLRNREFVFNHTSKDATTYESPRRALYLPVIRNHLYDLLEQFDYPDPTMPTGSRNSTVIAPQALIMLNAPVVMESSRRLAAKLCALPGDQRLEQAYRLLYGRRPTDRESRQAEGFLQEVGGDRPDEKTWAILCQTLLAANEFIYLR